MRRRIAIGAYECFSSSCLSVSFRRQRAPPLKHLPSGIRIRIQSYASQKNNLKPKSNTKPRSNNSTQSKAFLTPQQNVRGTTFPTSEGDAKPIIASATQARVDNLTHPYPERIRVYHAGKGRIVFVSCFKLVGIFLSLWGAFILAPGYYYSPFEPTWMAPACLVVFAIPLVVMNLATAPFVLKIHLYLPSWARMSSARLHKYVASLPSSTEMEITSIRWALPRFTRLQAGELYIQQGSLVGSMTLRRDIPEAVKEQRRWYDKRLISKFLVAGKTGPDVPERGLWSAALESITRGWRANNQRQILPLRRPFPKDSKS